MASYWDSVLTKRISRRRAIAATGATAAGAALLAACGGGDDGGGSKEPVDKSGLLVPIKDETKDLVRGGIWKGSQTTPASLDPHLGGGQVANSWHNYAQLFRIKEGHLDSSTGEFEGELVESWELSPDKLTLTAKIKKGVLFAPKAPVNARELDAQDVVFSWDRYAKISPRRSELSNAANPTAPVLSVTQVDNNTITIKFNQPNATVLGGFAGTLPGTPYIVPREADGKFDLKGDSIGSGPFYLTEYAPGQGSKMKRNPGFKNVDDKNLPYVDEIHYFDIIDPAANAAQFKSGAIYDGFFSPIPVADLLTVKKEQPTLELYEGAFLNGGAIQPGQTRTLFGQNADSPFKDERVRQAYSMVIDRDLFQDIVFEVAKFESAGLAIKTFWDSAISAGAANNYAGWYLNPQDEKTFGENSKYYQFNVAEAKKLLTAAISKDKLETDLYYATPGAGGYPPFLYVRKDILVGMMETSGLFKLKPNELDFPSNWNPQFSRNKGKFTGMGIQLDTNELDTAVDLFSHYNSNGSRFFAGDSTMDDFTNKMLGEFDLKKRIDLAHQLQKYEGKMQFTPAAASAGTFRLAWPAVRNRRVWQGNGNRFLAHIWLDQTKPPFKSA